MTSVNPAAAAWPAPCPPLGRQAAELARRVFTLTSRRIHEDSRAQAMDEDGADVDATLGGDGEAFARIVRRHQDTIARQLHRFTRDRARLEELVQDVFVEAYGGLAGWRREAPLLHWLRRIAVRVGYRSWTDRARRDDPLDEQAARQLPAPPDRDAEVREAAEYVDVLLRKLAPRDRLVLTLLSVDGCSVAEAADLTGWTRSMVKVQAHRARKRLAALLPPEATS